MSTTDAEDYSPEKIEYYLKNWPDLQEAAQGGTSSIVGRGWGKGGDRLSLACLIADLERAADDLPQHWTGTLQVFRMQSRARVWSQRRLQLEEISLHTAAVRMARSLGWSESNP